MYPINIIHKTDLCLLAGIPASAGLVKLLLSPADKPGSIPLVCCAPSSLGSGRGELGSLVPGSSASSVIEIVVKPLKVQCWFSLGLSSHQWLRSCGEMNSVKQSHTNYENVTAELEKQTAKQIIGEANSDLYRSF